MSETRPLLSALAAERWAMERVHLYNLRERAAGYQSDLPIERLLTVRDADNSPAPVGYYVEAGVAIIEIVGTILKEVPWIYEMSGCDATSTLQVSDAITAALDDKDVDSILLYIDSPGGTIDGVQELADDIFAARSQKPVHALISDMAASAAYWLASQCTTIAANPTALVGSIGVYMVLDDTYRFWEGIGVSTRLIASGVDKGTHVEGAHIGEAELAQFRDDINGLADLFIDAVARGRGVPRDQIATLATGRCWLAGETTRGGPTALELGLIDLVENSDTTFWRIAETDRSILVTQDGEEPAMGLFRRSMAAAPLAAPEEETVDPQENVGNDDEVKPAEQDTGSADPDKANPDEQAEEVTADDDEAAKQEEDEQAEPEDDPAAKAVRDKAAAYIAALGSERAATALADGTGLHEALIAVRNEQDARIEALEADLKKANARLAELHADGEPEPFSTKAGDEDLTINPKHEANLGPNLGRTASAMRLPGKGD